MLGNIAVGLSVLAPAGMLADLARGLGVEIHTAGLLVTYGALILCISSPVGAWLTSRIDRRVLLTATTGILAAGEVATAFAPNYVAVLALRLLLLAAAALYTPQAAATVALIVPEKERPGAIAFVFLGWSLAIAGGLPLVTWLTAEFGWRTAYASLGGISLVICGLLWVSLPVGLKGRALSLSSFGIIARNAVIMLILLITLIATCGQFSVVVYLAPLLETLTGAGPALSGAFFAALGLMGLIGNIIATAIVPRLGTQRTLALSLGSMVLGMMLWALGAGVIVIMALGIVFWGLGFAASNSMQQARLAAAAPDLAGASIALNTSVLYVGQAIGSGIGGLLFAQAHFVAIGYVSAAFGLGALVVLALTWQRRPRAASAP